MSRLVPSQRRSLIQRHRKRAFLKGRLCQEAVLCGNSELAGDYAVHAARAAALVIHHANELYGESGWTADELELYFKLNVKYT